MKSRRSIAILVFCCCHRLNSMWYHQNIHFCYLRALKVATYYTSNPSDPPILNPSLFIYIHAELNSYDVIVLCQEDKAFEQNHKKRKKRHFKILWAIKIKLWILSKIFKVPLFYEFFRKSRQDLRKNPA